MLFLIEYDRSSGQIVEIQTFDKGERRKAEDVRLALELRLHLERIEREVVLLEAETEEALRKTHRRYFEDLAELATSRRTLDEIRE